MSDFERLCIRVDKVYDWVTRQVNKEYNFVGARGLAELGFSCKGKPNDDPCKLLDEDEDFFVSVVPTDNKGNEIPLSKVECREVGRRENVFVKDLDTELQIVKIKKQGYFVIELRLSEKDRKPACVSRPIPFCIFEKFLLCAPEGTEINCHIFDFDAAGVVCCNDGDFLDLNLNLLICQSVQVEAEVKIEIDGRVCQPREDIIEPIIDLVCPEISFPPQCPEIFPPNN